MSASMEDRGSSVDTTTWHKTGWKQLALDSTRSIGGDTLHQMSAFNRRKHASVYYHCYHMVSDSHSVVLPWQLYSSRLYGWNRNNRISFHRQAKTNHEYCMTGTPETNVPTMNVVGATGLLNHVKMRTGAHTAMQHGSFHIGSNRLQRLPSDYFTRQMTRTSETTFCPSFEFPIQWIVLFIVALSWARRLEDPRNFANALAPPFPLEGGSFSQQVQQYLPYHIVPFLNRRGGERVKAMIWRWAPRFIKLKRDLCIRSKNSNQWRQNDSFGVKSHLRESWHQTQTPRTHEQLTEDFLPFLALVGCT